MSASKEHLASIRCPRCGNDGRMGDGIRFIEDVRVWRQVLGPRRGLLEIESTVHVEDEPLPDSAPRFLCLGRSTLSVSPCGYTWMVPDWIASIIDWV
jgi:hypothetical protein